MMALREFAFKISNRRFVRSEGFLAAAIVAFAAFLRFYKLDEVPAKTFFIDHVYAIYDPFLYQIGLTELSARAVWLYILTGTYFPYSIFGPSTFFNLLPTAILGTLFVVVVYLLSREMFSGRVALISALLMAVTPWSLHYSRFQPFPAAYALYFTLAVLFLYKGVNSSAASGGEGRRKKLLWYGLAGITFGVSANILTNGLVFIPLSLIGFGLIYMKIRGGGINQISGVLVFVALFSLTLLPVIIESSDPNPLADRAVSFSTYSQSRGDLGVWLASIAERAQMHISPGFLVFLTPFEDDVPFKATMGKTDQMAYQTVPYGELNYYGILAYPGILLAAWMAAWKRSKTHAVLLVWVIAYLAASGMAAYDNPNPARNLPGMPAFVVLMAVAADFIIKLAQKLWKSHNGTNYPRLFLYGSLALLISVPSLLFLHEYYFVHPRESYRAFNYGYDQVANFLTADNLWGKNILIHDQLRRDWVLSLYSPEQPPASKIIDLGDKPALIYPFGQSQESISSSQRIINFDHGTIEYETRVNYDYTRGPSSTSMRLLNSEGAQQLALSIYAKNSTFAPSSYRISQKTEAAQSFEQRPLGKEIEYGEWQRVRLDIDPKTVSLYLDQRLITSWNRPVDGAYSTLEIGSESASVSFRNFVIRQDNEQAHEILLDMNLSRWKSNYATMFEVEKIPPYNNVATLSPDTNSDVILVSSFPDDERTLNASGLTYSLLKKIHYPDGTIAFYIFRVQSGAP